MFSCLLVVVVVVVVVVIVVVSSSSCLHFLLYDVSPSHDQVGDNPTLAAQIAGGTVPRRQWKWHITFNPTVTNSVGGSSEITWKAGRTKRSC
jgi:hypothetical protein